MSERHRLNRDERSEAGEIDLRALGAGVWRRKRWVILPSALAFGAALAFVTLSSPYFRSTALVLIENNAPIATRPEAAREPQLPDEQAVATQVQLIESRDLVRRVAEAQKLGDDPEFEVKDRSLVKRVLGFFGFGAVDENQPIKEQVVDKVAANLSAYPVQGARVVAIEFSSTNADTAARVANGFVEAYFDVQRSVKRDLNRQATSYYSNEIDALRKRVNDAEEKVERFRAEAGLLVGQNNTTVAAQQLGEASTQLINARTQQAESRAKSDTIRDYLRAGRAAEALDIANSELVRALAQQRSQLVAQIASEGRTLLAQHPRMRELNAQLGGLDGQIRAEAEKLARAYENEAKAAGARVVALQASLDAQKQVAATANDKDVQLRALEREARSQRDILEQMLARYREASAQDNPEALVADARVISRAAAPTEPYFPKKIPTVALATLAAFVLSLFAVATAEIFGGGARRETVGDATPPPAVGEVPVFGRFQAPGAQGYGASGPSSPAISGPRGEAIEAADATMVAALARQLSAMPTDDGALRILAAGATSSHGVGAVVMQLARIMSEAGRRVVAIDAGGGGGAMAEPGAAPGLSELLDGAATFAQAIQRDRRSRVHVVPRGGSSFGGLDGAAQDRLGVVLDALALTYDFVLIAAPSTAAGPFALHCAAAILVSTGGAADVATIEAHDSLTSTGIEDVVVLLVKDDDGDPEDGKRIAA